MTSQECTAGPADRLREAKRDLANSFFEEHPEYELLRRDITDELTPDLADQLKLYERLRIEILSQVRKHDRI